jgi:hypothetical protein
VAGIQFHGFTAPRVNCRILTPSDIDDDDDDDDDHDHDHDDHDFMTITVMIVTTTTHRHPKVPERDEGGGYPVPWLHGPEGELQDLDTPR